MGRSITMTAEEALIEKNRRGDTEAFGALIRLYEDKIFSLTQKVCAAAPEEADGIWQDTFVTAFQKLHLFRRQSQLGTWLYLIASNLCWMCLRKKKRELLVSVPDPDAVKDFICRPAHGTAKRQLQMEVRKALESAVRMGNSARRTR